MAFSEIACPLCTAPSELVFRVGDRFYRATDFVACYYRCRTCRSVFQWPMPDRGQVVSFYPKGYWREAPAAIAVMARMEKLYVHCMLRWDLLGWVSRLGLEPGSRFLDIGCGRGDLLAMVRRLGLEIHGLEGDPRAADFARHRLGPTVVQEDVEGWSPKPGMWRAIGCFHVLEHLTDPAGFLTRCHVSLADGGSLLLRVPSIESWQSRWFGASWKGLEAPRHLLLPSRAALDRLLRERGFVPRTWSTWSLRDGPPALASSLFPDGEPTRQQVLGYSKPLKKWVYLGLTLLAMPLEGVASLFRRGAMLTVIAEKA